MSVPQRSSPSLPEEPPSPKPWLFMDLDGVISPVPSQSQKASIRRNGPPTGYRTWPGAIYDMYVDERLLDWVGRLDHAYDVVWSSAWGDTLLPVVATPLGLGHWPVLTLPPVTEDAGGDTVGGPLGAKAEAIVKHLERNPRPFAWCDDFLTRRSIPKPLSSLGLPHLLVRPGSRTGLTPAHIEKLLEFARRHQNL